ncbi:hypothetical protein NQ317_004331 [Molorchus minor]|uniref:Uncharacterized protein n=1 Tax=Molorchus minor TaxID=1323400 RepID=A0ABQ9JYF7_9CUCU|nr:hypothetical protein NQ317_004331 [Molorchus minor]
MGMKFPQKFVLHLAHTSRVETRTAELERITAYGTWHIKNCSSAAGDNDADDAAAELLHMGQNHQGDEFGNDSKHHRELVVPHKHFNNTPIKENTTKPYSEINGLPRLVHLLGIDDIKLVTTQAGSLNHTSCILFKSILEKAGYERRHLPVLNSSPRSLNHLSRSVFLKKLPLCMEISWEYRQFALTAIRHVSGLKFVLLAIIFLCVSPSFISPVIQYRDPN